jgi:hypothetical protein
MGNVEVESSISGMLWIAGSCQCFCSCETAKMSIARLLGIPPVGSLFKAGE